MDNEVIPVKTGEIELKKMDRVSQAFAEASVKLSETADALAKALQVWIEEVWTPTLETASKAFSQLAEAWSDWCSGELEKKELIHKAQVYGLDGRVISLCEHRKERVRKKNLNRLRKEVERYERKERHRGGQGPKQSYGSGSGDCQPDEPVSGEAGCDESICRYHGEKLELLGREK